MADSYDQFSYGVEADGFDRYVMDGKRRVALVAMPGQEEYSRPWTPYLAEKGNPMVRLQADTLLPGGNAGHPVAIVQDWHAPGAMKVRAKVTLEPAKRSDDGITLRITLNGKLLHEAVVTGLVTWESAPLTVAKGAVLSLSVGPNRNARGDVTRYRITLMRAE